MIYSVYDYNRRVYNYYDAPGPSGTHASAPPKPLLAPTSMGVAPESATWKLPIGAKKIGSGPMPRGRIASSSSLGIGSFDASPGAIAGLAAIVVPILWLVRRKR